LLKIVSEFVQKVASILIADQARGDFFHDSDSFSVQVSNLGGQVLLSISVIGMLKLALFTIFLNIKIYIFVF